MVNTTKADFRSTNFWGILLHHKHTHYKPLDVQDGEYRYMKNSTVTCNWRIVKNLSMKQLQRVTTQHLEYIAGDKYSTRIYIHIYIYNVPDTILYLKTR